jgi:hypothetical protein
MRNIARLLFGPDGDRLLDLVTQDGRGEDGLAARTRAAGEWCQTTPGAGSLHARPPVRHRRRNYTTRGR